MDSPFRALRPTVQKAVAHRLGWTYFRPAQEAILTEFSHESNLLFTGPLGAGKSTGLALCLADSVFRKPIQALRHLVIVRSKESVERFQEIASACELEAPFWGSMNASQQRKLLSDPPAFLLCRPRELRKVSSSEIPLSHLETVVIDDLDSQLRGSTGSVLSFLLEKLFGSMENPPRRLGLAETVGDPERCLQWLCGSDCRASEVVALPSAGGSRKLDVERLPNFSKPAELLAVKVRGKNSLCLANSESLAGELSEDLERVGLRTGGPTRDCLITCDSRPKELGFNDLVSFHPPGRVEDLLRLLAYTDRTPGSVSRVSVVALHDTGFLSACVAVSLASRRWTEPIEPQDYDWPAFLGQLFEEILENLGVAPEAAVESLRGAYAVSGITEAEVREVLEELLNEDVLALRDRRYVLGARSEELFDIPNFAARTNEVDFRTSYILLDEQGRQFSTVDSWFLKAFDRLNHTGGFQLGTVSHRSGSVLAEPGSNLGPLTWEGPLQLFHPVLSGKIWELLTDTTVPGFLNSRSAAYLEDQRKLWEADRRQSTPVWKNEEKSLHSFAGGRVNALLARFHSYRTGDKVVLNNLEITASDHSLKESLEAFLELDESGLEALLQGLPRSRLLQLLPQRIQTRFLLKALFDLEGARTTAQKAMEARPLAAKLTTVEPKQDADTLTGDPFLAQLCHLARTEVTRNKWILLPNQQLGWSLGEQLLLQDCNWTNLRFTTPFQLALEVAAPHLLEQSIDPKPEGLGPDLIANLMQRLPSDTARHFRNLIRKPGMSGALWEAVLELRMAGLDSDAMQPDLFQPVAKGREFLALLRAYEDYLNEHALGDRAKVFTTALQYLEAGSTIQQDDLVLEYPYHAWSPLERRFLSTLPGARTPGWSYSSPLPRRWVFLAAERFAKKPSSGTGYARYSFFCAGRRDAELHEVLRRILSEKLPIDDVEVVVHDPDTFNLMWDKLKKFEIPATFEQGLPVAYCRVVQSLFGLMSWAEGNYPAFQLRELLLSGLISVPDVGTAQCVHYLDQAKIKWGQETYSHLLRALEAQKAHRSKSTELEPEQCEFASRSAKQVSILREWLEQALLLLPDNLNETTSLSNFAQRMDKLLEQLAPPQSPLESAGHSLVKRALQEIGQIGWDDVSSREAFRMLKDRLERTRVLASRPLPGKLHVATPTQLGASARGHVFLVGLEAGSLQLDCPEDPVLSDQERETLHPGLRRSEDASDEFQFQLQERLAAFTGELTMSYSCRDYRTGEQLFPSRLLFDSVRTLHPHLTDYEELSQIIGEPVAFYPENSSHSASETEWWLSRLQSSSNGAIDAVRDTFPWLARGEVGRSLRASKLFTPYDGLVTEAARIFDPRTTKLPLSASRLQSTASCPYRSYLDTVLRMRPLDIELPDPDRWLNAADRGTVLHETFANFYRRLRLEGRKPTSEDRRLLRNLMERELEKIRSVTPPPTEAVESQEVKKLERDLEKFLFLEQSRTEREIVACEVGFGLPNPDGEPLGTLEPVELHIAPDFTLWLRGRIDRLDRVGNDYEVIDYKSGRSLNCGNKKFVYHKGKLLQHALYALVAEKLLTQESPDARVTKSAYYFPVTKAERDWIEFPYPNLSELAEVLNLVLEPFRSGAFPHTYESDSACKFCDFQSACISHNDADVKAKVFSGDNSQLAFRRSLEEVQ